MIFQFSSVDVTKKEDKKSKSRIVNSGLVVKLSNPKHDNFPRRRYCDFLKSGTLAEKKISIKSLVSRQLKTFPGNKRMESHVSCYDFLFKPFQF